MIYYIMILTTTFLSFTANKMRKIKINYSFMSHIKQKDISNSVKAVICSFIPFIISGIRFDVGTDYLITYVPIFEKIKVNGNSIRDTGYGLINQIVLCFTDNYQWVFIITSFIISFLVFKAIFDQSKNPGFSALLYFITIFFFLTMNAIRQSIAISTCLYSIKYIKNKKLFKFIIICLIATSFHSTALIFMPFYWLCQISFKRNTILLVILFSMPITSLMNKTVIFLFSKIDFLNKYFGYYFKSSYNVQSIGTISVLMCLFIITICLYVQYKHIITYDCRIVLYSQVITLICNILLLYIPLTQRLGWYFNYIVILYLPNVIQEIKDKKVKILIIISVISIYSIYMFLTIFVKGYHEVLPYRTFFYN